MASTSWGTYSLPEPPRKPLTKLEQVSLIVSLRRENEALQAELSKLKAQVAGLPELKRQLRLKKGEIEYMRTYDRVHKRPVPTETELRAAGFRPGKPKSLPSGK